MSSKNNLEIKGNLREHPLVELLIEISKLRLNGSLRVEHEANKAVIYFDAGEIVFAVSNARQHRLSEMLLRENVITKERLAAIADFTNDFMLGKNLSKSGLLSKREVELLVTRQIEEILSAAFGWSAGEWIFSPLVRVKGDIRFKINLSQMAIDYARQQPYEMIARRFKSLKESFQTQSDAPTGIEMMPQEAFVFSRFEKSALSVETISALSGMPETETFKILYSLWLSGFVSRREWNRAFSERKTSAILSTSFTLKKDEKHAANEVRETVPVNMHGAIPQVKNPVNEDRKSAPPTEISLEDYLNRIENATNHYEFFALSSDALVSEIKTAYFAFARRFHPDLYHKQIGAEIHNRVQDAFTKIAHAYEILKVEKSREVYDFKLRKELEKNKNSPKNDSSPVTILDKQIQQAAEDFNAGFSYLMDEQIEAALPFLARAVHFNKNNARYHAFYGKALSYDKSQYHKAEAEMQTAVKLDAENVDFRLILAEFFVQVGFVKRAEGELNRLLTIFPNNNDARNMLDNLAKRPIK
ncbi:MAG: DUF4388 domain-containing protein [Pyrinomonadaceae bacterium]